MKEQIEEEYQDKEVYFDDLETDSGIPEFNYEDSTLGVPLTRFSTANLWY